jgi:CRISPR/Cas system CSM-associated protein Csm2 small subunit
MHKLYGLLHDTMRKNEMYERIKSYDDDTRCFNSFNAFATQFIQSAFAYHEQLYLSLD